jgi:O-antigen/teichoic acid export membrane protein
MSNTANIVIAMAIILLSPVLLPLVFGQEFSGSIVPIDDPFTGSVVCVMHTLLAAYFAAKDKVKYNLKASVLALAYHNPYLIFY